MSMKRRILAKASDGVKTGDGTGVGLFLPLPTALASKFPSLAPNDLSPPHTTFLYVGSVTPEQEDVLFREVSRAFEYVPPVIAVLRDQTEFKGPERKVSVQEVRFSHDLTAVRSRLWSQLVSSGIPVADSFPVYRPHVTLEYMDDVDAKYEGVTVSGSWTFDEIEVWGLPRMHTISFGISRNYEWPVTWR
jgi:2'-5' RNA ligase